MKKVTSGGGWQAIWRLLRKSGAQNPAPGHPNGWHIRIPFRTVTPSIIKMPVVLGMVFTVGCYRPSAKESSPLLDSEHAHFHVHAVDASHEHEHSDGAHGGHSHLHEHAESSAPKSRHD